MKHHIAVKFIAVLLAALSLFFAIASGAGIVVLAAGDLYENSVDDLYEENMASTRRHFAVNLVHRYASLNLGNLPEDYLNQYFGTHWQYDTFQYGSYFYTIRDENGNVVESTLEKAIPNAVRYRIQVTEVNYRNKVSVNPAGYSFVDVVITDQATASTDSYNSIPTEEPSVPATETPVTTAPMETMEETIAPSEDAVSNTEVPADSEPAADTTPEDTLPDAAPPYVPEDELTGSTPTGVLEDNGNETLPAPAQATGKSAGTGAYQEYDIYYDHETDQQMRLCYTIQELPPYTVELYLLPGAAPEEQVYSILQAVWTVRYELFYVLGISVLLFAVFSVYLCCAAGKKPGREEIKAGGLNCIPLDLYLAGGGFTIVTVVWLGFEAAEYLLRTSPKILAPFVGLTGYVCCLIFVGFCFACAAQFKTPGSYWLRNSITGRCFLLLGRLWNFSLDVLSRLWSHTPGSLRWCWQKLKTLCLWSWMLFLKIWNGFWRITGRLCRWTGKWLHRMYSLLPLTWQWLLVGCGMLLLVGMIFASNGEELLTVLCICLFFAIILYGAHAFGILMEGARRMGKGDLETMVSDQFLFGAFRDFARDLNALADVAVVAAQKQMKSERMKTELITNVSHDIKTPLTSIINYVDLLQKAETAEERETYLEVLSRQSMQLKKLIEDLMEMSKASTGNMNVDISSINAAEAINQALGEFADKLDRAQLTPVFRQPDSPIYMQADGRLAWRVMGNLLSNVVKYALPGTRVYIDLMELEGKVVISMKNISREELNVSADELLERFVRGDSSRNTEGSGLGLNIAQSLMDIQKGQLQLLVDGDLFKVTLVFPSATI